MSTDLLDGEYRTGQIKVHTAADFDGMRAAGKLAAECLDMLTPHVGPGAITDRLDTLAREFILDHGAIPACLGYRGYTKTTCISPNHIVCHGIPGERALREGDIVNIDITPLLDGWHGDSSRTYKVGAVSILADRLVTKAYEAMFAGIDAVRPGATLGDVGAAIDTLVRANGFSGVRDFCGHGIGLIFHDAPQVLHYGRAGTGIVLEPGMIFTIEPMLNAGSHQVKVMRDEWTTVTKDHSLSAQFEHTVAVTDTGVEIFTLSADERARRA